MTETPAPTIVSASQCFPDTHALRAFATTSGRSKWVWTLDAERNQLIVSLSPDALSHMDATDVRRGSEISYEDFKRAYLGAEETLVEPRIGDNEGLVSIPPSVMHTGTTWNVTAPPTALTDTEKQFLERNKELLMLPVLESRRLEEEQRVREEEERERRRKLKLQAKCVELVVRERAGNVETTQLVDSVVVDGTLTVQLSMSEVASIVDRVRRELDVR